ncbi:putative N-acetyltransferase YhbS [Bacillus sp. V-88]|nr:putative N-acetyltransferase YhbS [Bacillus sp. V-88]SLK15164.1 Predicted N-acetyltransferase YhbS [Bacillus sp. V-88]
MREMEIRKVTQSDVKELAILMNQLGYPTSLNEMKLRMAQIDSTPDYLTLVAEVKGKVAGMVGLTKGYYYEMDGCYVRIVALVVNSAFRNMGIGHELVSEAERWARHIGAKGIGLNSGNREERLKAHAFYRRRGYVAKSTGFAKNLNSNGQKEATHDSFQK